MLQFKQIMFHPAKDGMEEAIVVNILTGERRRLEPFNAYGKVWESVQRALHPDERLYFGYHQGGSA